MKYVPTFVPQNSEDLPRHLDQEFNRIADAVTPDRWEHSHIHVTAAYSAGAVPYIFADATAGAFSVFLPAPTDEMILTIKKLDVSANAVTVDPRESGSNSIDGAASYSLASQYDSVTLYWDKTSSEWWIV